jgi:ubiquinone/menaquinone biosynthesis C-methylase UbiE
MSGDSTAFGGAVDYRLGKVERLTRIGGRWLDCGCAKGDYTVGLIRHGASETVGTDVSRTEIVAARERWKEHGATSFVVAAAEEMPFPNESFDGILLNEVLEHVADEDRALQELRRLLVPGGHLLVFSPNRWFPFEGHGAVIGRIRLPFPVPLLPWLPARLTRRWRLARNYWPGELRDLVRSAGFDVVAVDSALPLFARYHWLPERIARLYERHFASIEQQRLVRRFGVSTIIAAQRPRS